MSLLKLKGPLQSEIMNELFDLYAQESDDVTFVCSDRKRIKFNRFILFAFSQDLRPFLEDSSSTFFLPDCSSSAMKHLLNILTFGFTNCNFKDVELEVIQAAKLLSINVVSIIVEQNNIGDKLEKTEDVWKNLSTTCRKDELLIETSTGLHESKNLFLNNEDKGIENIQANKDRIEDSDDHKTKGGDSANHQVENIKETENLDSVFTDIDLEKICQICFKEKKSFDLLLQHYCGAHFGDEIVYKFGPLLNLKDCIECDKKHSTMKKAVRHLAVNHDKLNVVLIENDLLPLPLEKSEAKQVINFKALKIVIGKRKSDIADETLIKKVKIESGENKTENKDNSSHTETVLNDNVKFDQNETKQNTLKAESDKISTQLITTKELKNSKKFNKIKDSQILKTLRDKTAIEVNNFGSLQTLTPQVSMQEGIFVKSNTVKDSTSTVDNDGACGIESDLQIIGTNNVVSLNGFDIVSGPILDVIGEEVILNEEVNLGEEVILNEDVTPILNNAESPILGEDIDSYKADPDPIVSEPNFIESHVDFNKTIMKEQKNCDKDSLGNSIQSLNPIDTSTILEQKDNEDLSMENEDFDHQLNTVCQLCSKEEKQANSMWNHYLIRHFSNKLKQEFSEFVKEKKCLICDKILGSKFATVKHVGNAHEKLNDIMLAEGLIPLPSKNSNKIPEPKLVDNVTLTSIKIECQEAIEPNIITQCDLKYSNDLNGKGSDNKGLDKQIGSDKNTDSDHLIAKIKENLEENSRQKELEEISPKVKIQELPPQEKSIQKIWQHSSVKEVVDDVSLQEEVVQNTSLPEEEIEDILIPDDEKESDELTCKVCNKIKSSLGELRKHYGSHYGRKMKERFGNIYKGNSCILCGQKNKTLVNFINHLSLKHDKLNETMLQQGMEYRETLVSVDNPLTKEEEETNKNDDNRPTDYMKKPESKEGIENQNIQPIKDVLGNKALESQDTEKSKNKDHLKFLNDIHDNSKTNSPILLGLVPTISDINIISNKKSKIQPYRPQVCSTNLEQVKIEEVSKTLAIHKFNCEVCSQEFQNKKDLHKHTLLMRHFFTCTKCNSTFKKKKQIDNHEEKCCKAEETQAKDIEENIPDLNNTSEEKIKLQTNATTDAASQAIVYQIQKSDLNQGSQNIIISQESTVLTGREVSIKVNKETVEDELSNITLKNKFVCEVCFEAFEDKKELHKHTLSTRHYFTCPNCNSTFKKKRQIAKHEEKCHPVQLSQTVQSISDLNSHNDTKIQIKSLPLDDSISTDICDSVSVQQDIIEEEASIHTLSTKHIFTCEKCNKTFKNEKQIRKHKQKCKSEQPQNDNENNENDKNKITENVLKNASEKENFKETVEIVPQIEMLSSTEKSMKTRDELENKEAEFTCDMCQETFSDKKKFFRHTVSKKHFFICPNSSCGSSFKRRVEYQNHTFECQQSNDKVSMIKEMDKVVGKKNPGKEEVSNIFESVKSKKSSRQKEEFSCDICPEQFNDKKAFVRHTLIKRHFFACEINCEKTFRKRDLFESHQKICG